ncbi:GNAT family N-acetyltransferase [Kitasatospora purpeofusca]|uniref:GNAT family N-acetyltransferase n=1 Tax=Kitasatospora purpeofusca TaxID=67352 RepID=UPI002A5A1187|nr:GNAT family N-acetyltransferase [Kitasatospora purpeofusca]MDY0812563.1 GNAT family N-acetyltransferase [Kitasatospora purpeofusca]
MNDKLTPTPKPHPEEHAMTTTSVADNPEKSRYEITADGELAGFAEYFRHDDEIAFIHTEIGPEFGGQGLGGILARTVLDDARARGLAVLPYCPFIRGWLTKHPDYHDLVPAAQHERFGL